MTPIRSALVLAAALLTWSCGGDAPEPITVAWTFASGDCSSNAVDKVRITYFMDSVPSDPFEFPCADGSGSIGVLEAGSYGIQADGLDAGGKVVVQNYGTTITFGPEGIFGPVEVTLQPKAANVKVTWTVQGSGNCPPNVQIPFFIALYEPPPQGQDLGEKVTEVQESCINGEATLTNVAPGSYVVEVDTRAVTPARRGTSPVTVERGTDAEVEVTMQ